MLQDGKRFREMKGYIRDTFFFLDKKIYKTLFQIDYIHLLMTEFFRLNLKYSRGCKYRSILTSLDSFERKKNVYDNLINFCFLILANTGDMIFFTEPMIKSLKIQV